MSDGEDVIKYDCQRKIEGWHNHRVMVTMWTDDTPNDRKRRKGYEASEIAKMRISIYGIAPDFDEKAQDY